MAYFIKVSNLHEYNLDDYLVCSYKTTKSNIVRGVANFMIPIDLGHLRLLDKITSNWEVVVTQPNVHFDARTVYDLFNSKLVDQRAMFVLVAENSFCQAWAWHSPFSRTNYVFITFQCDDLDSDFRDRLRETVKHRFEDISIQPVHWFYTYAAESWNADHHHDDMAFMLKLADVKVGRGVEVKFHNTYLLDDDDDVDYQFYLTKVKRNS